LYAQALLLTGQFEAGVEFMSRVSGLKGHAVHIALALNENNLLLTSEARSPLRKPPILKEFFIRLDFYINT